MVSTSGTYVVRQEKEMNDFRDLHRVDKNLKNEMLKKEKEIASIVDSSSKHCRPQSSRACIPAPKHVIKNTANESRDNTKNSQSTPESESSYKKKVQCV